MIFSTPASDYLWTPECFNPAYIILVLSGGFLSHRGTPSHYPFLYRWDVPWNKPSGFRGTPSHRKPPHPASSPLEIYIRPQALAVVCQPSTSWPPRLREFLASDNLGKPHETAISSWVYHHVPGPLGAFHTWEITTMIDLERKILWKWMIWGWNPTFALKITQSCREIFQHGAYGIVFPGAGGTPRPLQGSGLRGETARDWAKGGTCRSFLWRDMVTID